MWQRFTERSRRVFFFAQEEAGRLGENYVSTEHLLLGLLRENDSVASRVLERMGVSLSRIRSEIERHVARGDGRLGQEMQLTPRAKRIIDLAHEEARQMDNTYIGTEHLLLGMLREGEGLAGRVLNKLGVDLERTRREVRFQQDLDVRRASTETTQETFSENIAALQAKRKAEEIQAMDGPDKADIGDLGVVKPDADRPRAEVAFDTASFLALVDIFRARDAHGYRAMAHGDQTMFLVPSDIPLKVLVPPEGSIAAGAARLRGHYVRVLEGDYAGYAGWIFHENFAHTGSDDAPFPPEPEA